MFATLITIIMVVSVLILIGLWRGSDKTVSRKEWEEINKDPWTGI